MTGPGLSTSHCCGSGGVELRRGPLTTRPWGSPPARGPRAVGAAPGVWPCPPPGRGAGAPNKPAGWPDRCVASGRPGAASGRSDGVHSRLSCAPIASELHSMSSGDDSQAVPRSRARPPEIASELGKRVPPPGGDRPRPWRGHERENLAERDLRAVRGRSETRASLVECCDHLCRFALAELVRVPATPAGRRRSRPCGGRRTARRTRRRRPTSGPRACRAARSGASRHPCRRSG